MPGGRRCLCWPPARGIAHTVRFSTHVRTRAGLMLSSDEHGCCKKMAATGMRQALRVRYTSGEAGGEGSPHHSSLFFVEGIAEDLAWKCVEKDPPLPPHQQKRWSGDWSASTQRRPAVSMQQEGGSQFQRRGQAGGSPARPGTRRHKCPTPRSRWCSCRGYLPGACWNLRARAAAGAQAGSRARRKFAPSAQISV